jgi:hypothetical protein
MNYKLIRQALENYWVVNSIDFTRAGNWKQKACMAIKLSVIEDWQAFLKQYPYDFKEYLNEYSPNQYAWRVEFEPGLMEHIRDAIKAEKNLLLEYLREDDDQINMEETLHSFEEMEYDGTTMEDWL